MRRSTIPWTHFGLLLFLGSLAQIAVPIIWLNSNGATWTEALRGTAPGLPGVIYGMVPIAAGATGALLVFVGPTRAVLLRLALVASVLMVTIDALSPRAIAPVTASMAVFSGSPEVIVSPNLSRLSRESALRTAMSIATGTFGDISNRGDGQSFSSDDPRLRASFAIQKSGLMLLPMLLLAIAVGAARWLQAGVVFTTMRHFRIVSIALAWSVSIGGVALVHVAGEKARVAAMIGNSPLTAILLPYAPLAVLAFLLWRHIPKGEENVISSRRVRQGAR